MAKDPAFLFYPGDWLGGTMLLTRHQKGCYIDLLMAQFNTGPLSLDQIKVILGQDQAVWTVLREKFKTDNSGKFFNEKLATEIEKRKVFSQSRRENIKKRYQKSTSVDTSVVHTNLRMENEIENENKTGTKSSVENPIGSEKVQQIANSVWKDCIWKESVCMGHQLKPPELKLWMAQFNTSVANDTIPRFTESTYKKMFGGWLNTQRAKGYKLPEKQNSTQSQLRTIT